MGNDIETSELLSPALVFIVSNNSIAKIVFISDTTNFYRLLSH